MPLGFMAHRYHVSCCGIGFRATRPKLRFVPKPNTRCPICFRAWLNPVGSPPDALWMLPEKRLEISPGLTSASCGKWFKTADGLGIQPP